MTETSDIDLKSKVNEIRKPVETRTGIKFYGLKTRRELASESLRDALTGLWNRKGWIQKEADLVRLATRLGQEISYISCDLDELKELNDSEGHQKGDELIKATAAGLKKSLRETDLVARAGGDEFYIALLNTDLQGAEDVRERIIKNLGDIKISIGIGSTLNEADLAMFAQKSQRKNE